MAGEVKEEFWGGMLVRINAQSYSTFRRFSSYGNSCCVFHQTVEPQKCLTMLLKGFFKYGTTNSASNLRCRFLSSIMLLIGITKCVHIFLTLHSLPRLSLPVWNTSVLLPTISNSFHSGWATCEKTKSSATYSAKIKSFFYEEKGINIIFSAEIYVDKFLWS